MTETNPPPAPAGHARGKRSKVAIVEIAAGALAAHGFAGVSLNEIIRRSGLTKGAFYFHFASKEDLVLQVFRSKQAELVAGVKAASKPRPDGLSQLLEVVRVRARLLSADPSLRCFLRTARDLGAIYGPGSEFARSYGVATSVFETFIRRGLADGSIRAGIRPLQAATFVFSLLLGADELSLAQSSGLDLAARSRNLIPFIRLALASERPCPKSTERSTK